MQTSSLSGNIYWMDQNLDKEKLSTTGGIEKLVNSDGVLSYHCHQGQDYTHVFYRVVCLFRDNPHLNPGFYCKGFYPYLFLHFGGTKQQ
ncbi:hypothetical protein CI610_02837 [invertebrate metagenome]|uniref:Uncharacterized protein n=1 Tax=invertebrate metagenome TaxID=1711999 RepID=A0A2H9T4T9_9ZZZZ